MFHRPTSFRTAFVRSFPGSKRSALTAIGHDRFVISVLTTRSAPVRCALVDAPAAIAPSAIFAPAQLERAQGAQQA